MTDRADPTHGVGVAMTMLMRLGADPRLAERGPDGIWCYTGTDEAVPGAADVTLGETVEVRIVSRPGGEPESVLVERQEVERVEGLVWVPEAGRELRGDTPADDVFAIPWAVWQERAAAAVGVRAPEWDGRGLERIMAAEEGELRRTRWVLDQLTVRRSRSVAIATGLGMTRRAVGDLLGLSAGRVQQLVEDAPERVRVEVDDLLRDTLTTLRTVGPRTLARGEIELPPGRGEDFLDELLAWGLLEQDGNDQVGLTEEGEQAELYLRTDGRKRGSRA